MVGFFYLFISTQYPTTIVSSSKKPFLVFVELCCGTCVPAPLHHCPTFRTPEKIHYLRTDFLAWLPLCQWQVIFFSVLVAVTLDQGRLRLWQRNTRSSSTCPVSVSKKRCSWCTAAVDLKVKPEDTYDTATTGILQFGILFQQPRRLNNKDDYSRDLVVLPVTCLHSTAEITQCVSDFLCIT